MESDKPIKLRGSRKAMPILSNVISWLFAPLSPQPAARHRPDSSSARRHRSPVCVRETDSCIGVMHDVAAPRGSFSQLCGALPGVCCAGRGRGDGNCLADRRRGLIFSPHAQAWGERFVCARREGRFPPSSSLVVVGAGDGQAPVTPEAAAVQPPQPPPRPGAAAGPVPRPGAGSLQTQAWPHKARRPPL